MRIAYFLMIHRVDDLFSRLLHAIYDPGSTYLVHIDRKVGSAVEHAARQVLASYPNAHLMERYNCVLAGWSMVQIELSGMDRLLRLSSDWDFLINLSGACFPLRTQAEIRAYLDQHPLANSLDVRDEHQWPAIHDRMRRWALEINTPMYSRMLVLRGFSRTPPPGCTPYGGGAWHILSRPFCEHVVHAPELEPLKRFFRHVSAPEEGFFQTALMNGRFRGTLINKDHREIVWPKWPAGTLGRRMRWFLTGRWPHSPKTFGIGDFEYLRASPAFFARKFDPAHDSEIIPALEALLKSRGAPEPSQVPPG
jgi:hypothetical protein